MMIKIFNEHIWKKAKVKLAPFVLATTMIFSGCAKINDREENKQYINNLKTQIEMEQEIEEEIEILEMEDEYALENEVFDKEQTENINNEENYIIEDTFLNTKVNISSEEIDLYKMRVDEVNVDYKYSDLFQTDKALQEYNKISVSSDLGKPFKINEEELYLTVLENNAKYLLEHPYKSYDNTSNKDIKKIVSIVVENLNNKMATNENIDYNQLSKTLKNLKVFTYSGFEAGAIDDKEVILLIDLGTVNNFQKLYQDIDAMEMVVKHESNHLIQVTSGASLNGKNYEKNYGICYKFSNLEINPLDNQWLIESTCEKQVLNDYNDNRDSLFYKNSLLSLDSLTLSIILNENNNTTSIEDAMFQHNLEKFFNLFNITSDSQKKEIINMLYAYEIIHYEKDDFKNIYQKNYGERLSFSELDEYKTDLKGSISLTLSKIFYKNLAETMKNKEVKIQDIYVLISTFENEISRFTWYASEYNHYGTFLRDYTIMQSDFFEIISQSIEINSDTLLQQYNSYHQKASTGIHINWLNSDKNEFLKRIAATREKDRMRSINTIYKSLTNKNIYKN